MTAIVVKVNGLSPEEWQADPTHIYVGRDFFIRRGPYAHQKWDNSGLGNPFKFEEDDTPVEKRMKLFGYCKWLKTQLTASSILNDKWRGIVGMAATETVSLGCWCMNWNAIGHPPLCHACYLADIINAMNGDRSRGALVYESGQICSFHDTIEEQIGGGPHVTFRK